MLSCVRTAVVVLTVFTVTAPRVCAQGEAEKVQWFETNIRPLLVTRCYSCHSQGAGKREGGLLLDTRAGWAAGGDRGATIVAGDPDASLLVRAVRYTDDELQMPPARKLTAREVKLLEHWVRLGAPDPREGEAVAGDIDPSDPVAGRSHWAFRPLAGPSIPPVHDASWPLSPIDNFVLRRLEAEDLRPAGAADRRTLARRIYVQLIGLPPTPGQLQSFLEDDRPDAVAHLVDTLLDSPQFGERWGRHWLDLARYADSNGLDENFLFREAWRYRNRVIDVFNADMPFDRWVLEQLAGDLLPFESMGQRDRQRLSAGFLVIGPKVLLGNDARERRMDVADEQLDTIGRAVLGQTLGCARCHDHKFDPVPTADYYALAGIMTSTEVMETRYMLGQQRLMEQLVGLGETGADADARYEAYWRERPSRMEKAKHAKTTLDLLKKGDAAAIAMHIAAHGDAVAAGAKDTDVDLKQRIAAQDKFLKEMARSLTPPAIPPRGMIPADREKPQDEHIRLAGEFNRPGEKVPRGFLRVLSDTNTTSSIGADASGRRELAEWLTNTESGAGHLAARVLANRVWHHLIGRGLVRTVDNFGRTGEPPTHPDLLDHLAGRLVESGWSVKSLVRDVVLTRTFAMDSRHVGRAHTIDPENRLLWRANRRRLDPETLRDAMLLAAGKLDPTPMDSSVWYLGDQATAVGDNKNRRRTDFNCRSVYLPVIRNDLPELFDVFDFADPHASTGARPETMVATQGLFLLNDPSVMSAAESVATRVVSEASEPTERVDRMFQLVTGAAPTDEEQAAILAFIEQAGSALAAPANDDIQAWAMACHALFASSRFQILE